MFVAGTDTSAAVVVWAMTCLTMNPTATRQAHYGIRYKSFVDEDDIQKLNYLRAVAEETIRRVRCTN